MRRLTQIPSLHDDKIAAAHANLTRLSGMAAEYTRAIEAAEAEHVAALASDRDACAKAMREGGKEPKPTADEAKAAIEAVKRQHEAAEQAVGEAEQLLADLIEANRAALQRQVAERLDAKRQAFRAALDALASAEAELVVEEKTSTWLAEWPDSRLGGGRRFMPDLPVLPTGDPVSVETVLDALRKRGLPPEPHRPKGALRFALGAVAPPSAPLIQSLTGPEAA